MRFFLLWGFVVWLSASALFRFAGHYFFVLERPVLMITSYILVIPLILVLTIPVFSYKKVSNKARRLQAAIFIALPGMLIDAVVIVFFDKIFTNLPAELDRYFASWLLWAYALIVMTGFTSSSYSRSVT